MRLRKHGNKKFIYKLLSTILIITSLVFLGMLFYIDLLPQKYLATITLVVAIFDFLSVSMMSIKKLKKKIKAAISILSIIAIFIMGIAGFYMIKTLNVLVNSGDSKYKVENYSVIVIDDSDYDKIEDIKGEKVGYLKNYAGSTLAISALQKLVDVSFDDYNSSDQLISDLLNGNINVILLEDSMRTIVNEEIENFENSTRIIYTFKIKIESDTSGKEVNVTEEPFAIYISGIDTYGEISSVSRSDVNIIMVVNPNTHQVLLISIPRDYYVKLHDTEGPKDKLTHAGIYGIDMSIKTLEDLLDMDINYYIKVNFTSVIDIVDALGGLDVYSEYSFISFSDFNFKKGMNYVDGEQALDFARTRKAFVDGDRQRGKNQQAVIEALIRKLTSKSVITKYNSLLNAIDGKYQTNIGTKKITSLIKMQLNDMPSWTVTSYSLTGYDSMNYTYTYNQLLYVMEPDEDTLEEAKQLVKQVLGDEQLESSYDSIDGKSNKVTRVYTENQTQSSETYNTDNSEEDSNEEIIKEEPNSDENSESEESNENTGEEDENNENEEPENNLEDSGNNTLPSNSSENE